MSSSGGLRGVLRKAAELVVELPPEEYEPVPDESAPVAPPRTAPVDPPAKTVSQIARELPGPNLEDVSVQPEVAKAMPDGSVDFATVYKSASIAEPGLTAEQVLEMIAGLPAELPLEAKRQTVKVTLGTMGRALGVTSETVVADASRKLAAIAAYEEQHQSLTRELVAKASEAIEQMEATISERKRSIALAQARAAQVSAQCKAEADRLDDVLEFLSQDVPPSRNAPPSSGS